MINKLKAITKGIENTLKSINKLIEKAEQEKEATAKQVKIEDIRKELFNNGSFYEEYQGNIVSEGSYYDIDQVTNCYSKNQIIQEQARRDLYLVSVWLNNGEELKYEKRYLYYCFFININSLEYETIKDIYSGQILFKSGEQCEEAKKILSEERIKQALGVFE